MQFRSERERMQHPAASLIPVEIWRRFFNKQLTKLDFHLLKNQHKEIKFNKDWLNEVMGPYLCVLYAHSSHSAIQIINLFQNKQFQLERLAQAAVIAGRIDVLRLLSEIAHSDLTRTIECEDFSLIRLAAQYSSLKTIKKLMHAYRGDVRIILRSNSFSLFQWSCARGYVALFDYVLQLAPEMNDEMISYNQYNGLRDAVRGGKIIILKRMMECFPHYVPLILEEKNYQIFADAAKSENIAPLKFLLSLEPEKRNKILMCGDYKVVRSASVVGRLRIIKYIFKLLSSDIHNMIAANSYELVHNAARYKDMKCLKFYLKNVPDKIEEIIQVKSYSVFKSAVIEGHLEVIKYIISLKPEWLADMIRADNYSVFHELAYSNTLPVLQFLAESLPDEIPYMINAEFCASFRNAARRGQLATIDYLVALYPNGVRWMVAANQFAAFCNAASGHHLPVLQRLVTLAGERAVTMLCANNYKAFHAALGYGSTIEIIDFFINLAGDRAEEMVFSQQYKVFQNTNNLPVLRYLMELFPQHQNKIIWSDNYAIVKNAALHGNFEILNYIIKLRPKDVQQMLSVDNYRPFSSAALCNRDTEMMRYLIKLCAPHKRREMICAQSFRAFECASKGSLFNNAAHKLRYLFGLLMAPAEDIISSNNFIIVRQAIKNEILPIVHLLFERAPEMIQRLIDADHGLIEEAILRERLAIVEFLLRCSSDSTKIKLFVYPKTPIHTVWDTNDVLQADNVFTSRTLFENPSAWNLETIQSVVFSCIRQGYFSITKNLVHQLWKKEACYDALLIDEILMKAAYYPNQTAELLVFLIEIMGFDLKQLKKSLKKIPSENLSLAFWNRLNSVRN